MPAPSSHSNEFYVTLPSNASMKFYPENTAGKYKVQLAQPINLRGRWEVALAEIQYPRTWKNVHRDATFTYFHQRDGEQWDVKIPAGHYGTVQELLDLIREGMHDDEARKAILFEYRPQTSKVETTVTDGYGIYWRDELLKQLLGIQVDVVPMALMAKGTRGGLIPRRTIDEATAEALRGNDPVTKSILAAMAAKGIGGLPTGEDDVMPLKTKAKYPVDPNLGFYSLFLYLDIIAPVLVGDAAVPLLQIVPIEGRYGDYVTKTYHKLHYVPLQATNFQRIEINISTDTGQDVQFDYGKVVVKLHFRPRRLPFM